MLGPTLKSGMMERRNGGITEHWKMTPNPKRRNRGTAEGQKMTRNPKRLDDAEHQNGGKFLETPKME